MTKIHEDKETAEIRKEMKRIQAKKAPPAPLHTLRGDLAEAREVVQRLRRMTAWEFMVERSAGRI